jgi:hypothetical protein
MLSIVVAIAVVAALALVLAIFSGSVLLCWVTVCLSAAGLCVLVVEKLRQYGRNDSEPDVDLSPPRHAEFDQPPGDERSAATELAHSEEGPRPVIWPPEHPVHEISSNSDQIESRRMREEEAPRPDIWP